MNRDTNTAAILGYTALLFITLALIATCVAVGVEFGLTRGLLAFAAVLVAFSVACIIAAKWVLK